MSAVNQKVENRQIYDLLVSQEALKTNLKMHAIKDVTRAWQKREISNYEYLAFLNAVGDRTIHDLTQYPVFPWIIQDYESSTLDLEDKRIYRDLSKPIGALNGDRLQSFKDRYNQMVAQMSEIGEENVEPPFLYGTHYSSPGMQVGHL